MSALAVPPDHIKRLDVLRGLAILSVFLFHFLGTALGVDHLPWNGWWPDWSAAPDRTYFWLSPLTFGWVGVSIFFVLSGFCIQLSVLRKPTFSTGAFYRARFRRIYPAYLVALLAFAMIEPGRFAHAERWFDLLAHLTFTHNFFGSTYYSFTPAFWSLAVECQFYLAFPLFLALRARLGIGRTLAATFALAVVVRAGIALLSDWSQPFPAVWLYSVPALWFDWILGAYLAECVHEKREPQFPRHPLFLPALGALFVFSTIFKPLSLFSFTIASVASAAIMARYLRRKTALSWWESACVPLGLVSYSFYLWHQPLIGRVLKALHLAGLPHSHPWVFTVGLAATFAIIGGVSWFLYQQVEHRFMTRRPRPAPVPPVESHAY